MKTISCSDFGPNSLTEFPMGLVHMTKLISLLRFFSSCIDPNRWNKRLDTNFITSIPTEIGFLTSVTYMLLTKYLRFCLMAGILCATDSHRSQLKSANSPESTKSIPIRNTKARVHFFLYDNYLTDIPTEFLQLSPAQATDVFASYNGHTTHKITQDTIQRWRISQRKHA